MALSHMGQWMDHFSTSKPTVIFVPNGVDDPPSVSHSGAMVGLGSQQRNGIRRESQIKYKFHADICKFLWEPSQTLHIHICITYACLESQCASDENVRCNSWENKLLLLNDCIITMHEIVTGIHILKRQPLYSGLNELIAYYSGMQYSNTTHPAINSLNHDNVIHRIK